MNSKAVQDSFHGYRKPVYRPSTGDIQVVLFRPSREVQTLFSKPLAQRRDFQPPHEIVILRCSITAAPRYRDSQQCRVSDEFYARAIWYCLRAGTGVL